MATDSEIIDRIGLEDYYKHENRHIVQLCKSVGLSQSQTCTALNNWLVSCGKGNETVHLSYVKRRWNPKVKP